MATINYQNLTIDEINAELQQGGKFVTYTWVVSIVVMTFKRPSKTIYFLKHDDHAIKFGWPYLLLSFFLGWWGIPWGPIYTIQAIYNSFVGEDITNEVLDVLNGNGE